MNTLKKMEIFILDRTFGQKKGELKAPQVLH
jgi:hypothetical protein